jgi:hypothetical protein
MMNLNPLDVLKKRSVSWIPPHFAKIKIPHQFYNTDLEDWIKYKLKGRYFLIPSSDSHTALLGFEDDKELTFFMLACPHFRRI